MKQSISAYKLAMLGMSLASAVATSSAQATFACNDLTPPGVGGSLQSVVPEQIGGTLSGIPGGVVASTLHAVIFPTVGDPIDLHPAFLDYAPLNAGGNSVLTGTDGATQVGYGFGAATFQQRVAVRWQGSAASAEVLLPPFNTFGSVATGVFGGQAVGYASTVQTVGGRGTLHSFAGPIHAILWAPGTTVGIDLNNGAESTLAFATDGNHQVGFGGKYDQFGQLLESKAMMWAGSRDSFVWLHPTSGYTSSMAVAVSGTWQAGHAEVTLQVGKNKVVFSHAMVWQGTAASAHELLPISNLPNYFATGVSGGRAVGYGNEATGASHALYWATPTSTPVDLNQFLPNGYSNAVANGIDSTGRIVGTAFNGAGQRAIVWTPV